MRLGYSGGGRAEVVQGTERGVGHHQRVVVSTPAALSADAQHHLGREKLDHHLPATDGDLAAFYPARGCCAGLRHLSYADRRRRHRITA